MSVIAFDWKILAIDRMICNSNRACRTQKWLIWKDGTILSWVGRQDQGLYLANWYVTGCAKDRWPKFQESDNTTTILVVMKPGEFIGTFETQPFMIEESREEPFLAWGSGDDLAIGAMAMGASSAKAVEIASRYNIYCGMGVDVFDFKPI